MTKPHSSAILISIVEKFVCHPGQADWSRCNYGCYKDGMKLFDQVRESFERADVTNIERLKAQYLCEMSEERRYLPSDLARFYIALVASHFADGQGTDPELAESILVLEECYSDLLGRREVLRVAFEEMRHANS